MTEATNKHPDFQSLEEARIWLRQQAKKKGAMCPICHQNVKIYPRPLNASMARALIAIYHFFETNRGADWCDINQYLMTKGLHSGKCNVALLRHWKLLDRKEGEKKADGNPNVGLYRLTERGRDFVLGWISVEKFIYLYNNKLLTTQGEQEQITIRQALGQKFNYEDLMTETRVIVNLERREVTPRLF